MSRAEYRQELLKNFMKCGLAGWGMEIMYTAAGSIAAGDRCLMGRTSLLMFPIYGLGVLLVPISSFLDRWLENGDKLTLRDRIWRHGINDMVLIFLAEYLFGSLLRLYQICPWDYSGCLFNVDGVIRLDFAPYWFFAGLLFETLTGGFRKT